jgi:hypothetical protein
MIPGGRGHGAGLPSVGRPARRGLERLLALVLALGLAFSPATAARALAGPASKIDGELLATVRRAESLLDALEYERAREVLEASARDERFRRASASAKGKLWVLLGRARAELGDSVGSEDAFGTAVRWDKKVRLARSTSPKILETLERARANASPGPLPEEGEEAEEQARTEQARRHAEEQEQARVAAAKKKAEAEEQARAAAAKKKAEAEAQARAAAAKEKAEAEAQARAAAAKKKAEAEEQARAAAAKKKAEAEEQARAAAARKKAEAEAQARAAAAKPPKGRADARTFEQQEADRRAVAERTAGGARDEPRAQGSAVAPASAPEAREAPREAAQPRETARAPGSPPAPPAERPATEARDVQRTAPKAPPTAPRGPWLAPRVVGELAPGRKVMLVVEHGGMPKAARFELWVKRSQTGSFRKSELPRTGTVASTLLDLDRPRLEYFVEARQGQRVLARAGSDAEPLSISTVPPPPPLVVAWAEPKATATASVAPSRTATAAVAAVPPRAPQPAREAPSTSGLTDGEILMIVAGGAVLVAGVAVAAVLLAGGEPACDVGEGLGCTEVRVLPLLSF